MRGVCARARNSYSAERLKSDFRDGLAEVGGGLGDRGGRDQTDKRGLSAAGWMELLRRWMNSMHALPMLSGARSRKSAV
jgi:hypothetical protein